MPHSQILASPPDRDSLFNSVLEVSFWTIVWFGVVLLTRITVNIPKSIEQEEDKKKKRKNRESFINYTVSLLHAIVWVGISGYSLLKNPWTRARPFTDLEMFAIKSSYGYFIMDTILGIKTGVNDIWMNIHHVGIMICYSQSIALNNSGFEMILAAFLGELTNPLNCLRNLFELEGRKEAASICSKWFAALFLFVRGVFTTLAGAFTVLSPKISYILKVNCCLMLFVSYIWVWRILNQGSKQLWEGDPSNQLLSKFYTTLVSLRKYSLVLNGLFFVSAFYWLVVSISYDVKGAWPQRYLTA
jgi:hypothetical protein